MIPTTERRLLLFNVTVALLLVLVTIPVRYLTGLGDWSSMLWLIPLGWWLWYRGALPGHYAKIMLGFVIFSATKTLLLQIVFPAALPFDIEIDFAGLLAITFYFRLRDPGLEPAR